MAWNRLDLSNVSYIDCADRVASFLTRTRQPSAVTPGANTGNGIVFGLSSTASSVTETITLTCLAGATTFSVVGSVSGAIGTATINVPFASTVICFTIIGGTVSFVQNDSFSFTVGTATANWTQMRNETRRDGQTGKEYVFKGRGGGSDEIYIGIRTLTGSGYYNWELQCFTGYLEAIAFQLLPGYQTSPSLYTSFPGTGSVTLWLWESARRLLVIPVHASDYHGQVYLGWILPTSTPSQWGNPLFIGGDSATDTTTYTGSRSAWWKTKSRGRQYDGAQWDLNTDVWPYRTYSAIKDVNGNFPLFPITLINAESVNRKIYGEAEGCYAVSADGGAVGTGDTIIANNEFYIITKNINVAGDSNIMAVKLI